jgi:hypothetical protein
MNRIAGEFCAWLRELPGEDRTVNQVTSQPLHGAKSFEASLPCSAVSVPWLHDRQENTFHFREYFRPKITQIYENLGENIRAN